MKPLLLKFPPTGFLPEGALDVSAREAGTPTPGTLGARTPGGDAPTEPPVVCLHGTVANGGNWGNLAELLLARGRIVVAPTYGGRGTAPLAENLAEVTRIVRATLDITGAERVDLVGHSQGGLLAGLMVAEMLRGPGAPTTAGTQATAETRETAGTRDAAGRRRSRKAEPLPLGSVRRVVCMSGSHRGVRIPRGVPMSAIRATFGQALVDQIKLRNNLLGRAAGGNVTWKALPAVAKAAREALADLGDDGDSSTVLPEWFDLVTDADRIVPSDCALTADEYPGAATIRLEDRLGRGVPHQLQPHDRGVAELIAELLG